MRAVVAATGLAIAVAATGCTSSSKESSSSVGTTAAGLPQAGVTEAGTSAAAASSAAGVSAAASAAASAAPASGAAAAPASSAAAGASSAAASAPANNGLLEGRPAFQTDPTAGRSIIYTAHVDVQVPTAADVTTAVQKATDEAAAVNGYVFSLTGQAAKDNPPTPAGATTKPGEEASADLVLKVPPGDPYNQVLTQVGKIGITLDLSEKTSDVTNQVVDTQSRLTAQKASVERIRALLAKANTIGQIVQVEGELTRREADLESLEGTLAVLKSQTAMATIGLHIESAPAPVVTPTPKPTVPPVPKKHIHGFTGGLKAGSHSFVTAAVGVATVLGALLPYLALALVLAVVVWLVRRSWLKGHRPNPPAERVTP